MDKPEGKNKAIGSYLTIIGLLIALSMNKDRPNPFATWHIKNMFGLMIIYLIAFATSLHDNLLVFSQIVFYISIVFWLVSFVGCLMNKTYGIPVLSEKFQTWFKFLG